MTKDLIEGCVLSEDVKGLTTFPIIPKNTVLNKNHIEVLRAFLVEEVSIEPKYINGDDVGIDQNQDGKETKGIPQPINQYNQAVTDFMDIFSQWQSGSIIDIFKVRGILVPLLDVFLEEPKLLLSTYHYVEQNRYIYHHSLAVGLLSSFIAKKLGYKRGDYLQVGLAGLLSDCGMSKVSSYLFTKPSPLTPREKLMVQQHTVKGYKMLKNISAIQEGVLLAALQHHEREDGSGYPLGMTGDKLHPFSQIVAVCDTYHAMISNRYYQSKHSPLATIEILETEFFGKFHHKALKILQDEVISITIGTFVKLSNNQVAEIVFVQPRNPTRPMVKLENGDIISLQNQPQITITDFI